MSVKKNPKNLAPNPPVSEWKSQDLNPGLSDSKDQTFNHTSVVTVPDPYPDHEVAHLAIVQRGCGPILWFWAPTV